MFVDFGRFGSRWRSWLGCRRRCWRSCRRGRGRSRGWGRGRGRCWGWLGRVHICRIYCRLDHRLRHRLRHWLRHRKIMRILEVSCVGSTVHELLTRIWRRTRRRHHRTTHGWCSMGSWGKVTMGCSTWRTLIRCMTVARVSEWHKLLTYSNCRTTSLIGTVCLGR